MQLGSSLSGPESDPIAESLKVVIQEKFPSIQEQAPKKAVRRIAVNAVHKTKSEPAVSMFHSQINQPSIHSIKTRWPVAMRQPMGNRLIYSCTPQLLFLYEVLQFFLVLWGD